MKTNFRAVSAAGLGCVRWTASCSQSSWKIPSPSQHVETNVFKGCSSCAKAPCLFVRKCRLWGLFLPGPAFSRAAGCIKSIWWITIYFKIFSTGGSLLFLACTRLNGLLHYLPCFKTLIVWNGSVCAMTGPGRVWAFGIIVRLPTLRQQRKRVCESCVSIHAGGYLMIKRMPLIQVRYKTWLWFRFWGGFPAARTIFWVRSLTRKCLEKGVD